MRTEIEILRQSRDIAVLGATQNPNHPSYEVITHLQSWGYRVFAVNPACDRVLDLECYPSLSAIPQTVDIVVICSEPDDSPASVDEAIKAGVKAVWLNEGVISETLAQRARAKGLDVVMDRCIHCAAEEHGLFEESSVVPSEARG